MPTIKWRCFGFLDLLGLPGISAKEKIEREVDCELLVAFNSDNPDDVIWECFDTPNDLLHILTNKVKNILHRFIEILEAMKSYDAEKSI